VYVNGKISFNLANKILPFSTPTQTKGQPIYTVTGKSSPLKGSAAKYSRKPMPVFENFGAFKFAGVKENLPLIQSENWMSTLLKTIEQDGLV